jgi:hypothetical protein
MLHAITWKQFGIAIVSAGLLYYLFVLLKYYWPDIIAGWKEPIQHDGKHAAAHEVLGAAKVDESELKPVNAQELQFAALDEPAPADKHKVLLLGDLADCMQELKTLVKITVDEQDTKESFIPLLQLILSRHAHLIDGSFHEPIVQYLLDQDLPFDLTAEELEQTLTNAYTDNDLNDDHENSK